MRLHFLILFLILLFSFFAFTNARGHAAQEAKEHPEISLKYDTDREWRGLISSLIPGNIADKFQAASFVSNLLGILITAASDKVQPGTQVPSDTPNGEPELLQRSVSALLSEETGKIIRCIETMINSSVALSMAFYDVLESASLDSLPSNDAPYTPLLKTVAKLVVAARDDLYARFPLPTTAPGHVERVKGVSETVEYLQQLVVRLARHYEIEQEVIERHMARVKPFFLDVGVLFGDVAELYPAAIEAVVLNLSAMLLPEALFVRSLVILYCFGPYVLGKDAISEWLLKHVSESLRI